MCVCVCVCVFGFVCVCVCVFEWRADESRGETACGRSLVVPSERRGLVASRLSPRFIKACCSVVGKTRVQVNCATETKARSFINASLSASSRSHTPAKNLSLFLPPPYLLPPTSRMLSQLASSLYPLTFFSCGCRAVMGMDVGSIRVKLYAVSRLTDRYTKLLSLSLSLSLSSLFLFIPHLQFSQKLHTRSFKPTFLKPIPFSCTDESLNLQAVQGCLNAAAAAHRTEYAWIAYTRFKRYTKNLRVPLTHLLSISITGNPTYNFW